MNPIVEFAIMLRQNKKYREVQKVLEHGKTHLPISVYMGRTKYTTAELEKRVKTFFPMLDVQLAKSRQDEEYIYLAVHHPMVVFQDGTLVHFNPFNDIYLSGGGYDKEYLNPNLAVGLEHRIQEILLGPRLVTYKMLPIEIKLQFGCLTDPNQSDEEYMKGLVDEIINESPISGAEEVFNYADFEDSNAV